jgi:hypothetical protein
MYDLYPRGIQIAGVQDAWKTAPVAFEVCWVMGHWHDKGWDPDYIFDEAIKWHFSYFNTKSSAVPDDHWPAVNRCLKRMGYRFICRKFMCSPSIRRGEMLRYHSWWENRGCAPIYHHYDLVYQLKRGKMVVTLKTDTDITKWLPGDIVVDDALAIPPRIARGKYKLRVAMVDPRSGEPAIRLAQKGRAEDGWYELGGIKIE